MRVDLSDIIDFIMCVFTYMYTIYGHPRYYVCGFKLLWYRLVLTKIFLTESFLVECFHSLIIELLKSLCWSLRPWRTIADHTHMKKPRYLFIPGAPTRKNWKQKKVFYFIGHVIESLLMLGSKTWLVKPFFPHLLKARGASTSTE